MQYGIGMGLKLPLIKFRLVIVLLMGANVPLLSAAAHSTQGASLEAAKSLIKSRSLGIDPNSVDTQTVQNRLQFIGANLADLQEAEIKAYLNFLRENDPIQESGYAAAVKQSGLNRSRITEGQSDLHNTFEYRLARQVVKNGLLRFRHNMVDPPSSIQDLELWLSSKQIQVMGLFGGLQQVGPFNSEFLKTQNWIFFHVDQSHETTYGPHQLFVKGDYAAKHGLIFPFVMGLDELAAAGSKMNPKAAQEFRELFNSKYKKTLDGLIDMMPNKWGQLSEEQKVSLLVHGSWRNGFRKLDLLERHPEIFKAFRNALINFMFTTEDYLDVVSLKMADHLRQQKKKNLIKYTAEMGLLMTAHWNKTNRHLIDRLVKQALQEANLPSHYELRIPVAIPVNALDLNSLQCQEALEGSPRK